ncbi:MAG: class I SAM-dependent methyltransferase [Candidatus Nanopelagicales bacterium]|nr:class I SAM-dependent methyltransferase [Candidatus Nanopelagicales bacterium]
MLHGFILGEAGKYMNISYNSPGLSDYYSHNRFKYSHFYPSERLALDLVAPGPTTTILDIGCACGGLGLALNEQFGCWQYTGLEIHAHAAELGGRLVEGFGGRVIAGDGLEGVALLEPAQTFNLVVSLSAVDWNE